ncbi:MAG: Fe(3+) ABC transporter substrate-binding protein, partial [Pseudomonadota bacterium]
MAAVCLQIVLPAMAQEKTLNLYSSRHYQTDEALYSNFARQTGIRINRIEAGEDPLIERLKNEAASSPADVLVTVDAGRLWRAEQLGLFQSVKSNVLESRL